MGQRLLFGHQSRDVNVRHCFIVKCCERSVLKGAGCGKSGKTLHELSYSIFISLSNTAHEMKLRT